MRVDDVFFGSEGRIAFGNQLTSLVDIKTGTAFGTGLIPLELQCPADLARAAFWTDTFKHFSIIDVLYLPVNHAAGQYLPLT
jgi:hypothetical protein